MGNGEQDHGVTEPLLGSSRRTARSYLACPPSPPQPQSRPSAAQPPPIMPEALSSVYSDEPPSPSTFKATLAIGGMSCASCSNTITQELKKRAWISKVNVNLVTSSANVEIDSKDKAAQVVEAIEDMGFEAQLEDVVDLSKTLQERSRTVQIRVDGFHCGHCPVRAVKSLTELEGIVGVDQPTLSNPVIKVTYLPKSPKLTIRRILATITAADEAFRASLYHPPTLEQLTQQMHTKQQNQIILRLAVTFVIAIPTLIIGIVYMTLVPHDDAGRMYLMRPWISGINRAQIALFVLATPVFFFGADVFHRKAIKELYALWGPNSSTPVLRRFYHFGSMNMLMSLGTTIAYVSSICQLIIAGVTSPKSVDDSDFYFDSVVFLTLFLLTGRLIEAYSKSKTGSAVEALGKLRPTQAILVDWHAKQEPDRTVDVDLLDFGDMVRVPHGGSPPCDGKIYEGTTSFDESSLTGESRLIKKSTGDQVFSGTVNKDAPILVEVTGTAGRSMLDQIVDIVREGQTKRAPMEKIADVLTSYFVPVVTLTAIITWLTWLSLGYAGVVPSDWLNISAGGWAAFSLKFAIAVFVVACPCGLGLAAPTAIFVGGGLAAKYGILAKGGGEAFEKASHIDCVVFDKTGTLTEGGEPSIEDCAFDPDRFGIDDTSRGTLFSVIRSLEENSSHPIGKAIVKYCWEQSQERTEISNVQEIPGRGLKGTYVDEEPEKSYDVLVGNEALLKDCRLVISDTVRSYMHQWQGEAKSVALVATKPKGAADATWKVVTMLSIADRIRSETAPVIRALREGGTDVWMLSGDNMRTARAVAARVGIPEDNIIAEVLPAEKASKIKYLQSTLKARTSRHRESDSKRATVAMVGDGINDAPALAVADVGIAIGSGSDVAISSADFVLVQSDLRSVVTLLDLSRRVFFRIKLNFGWALVYNLVAVPFAAGCFYPLGIQLDPVWASLAMALSSISVVLSSLALKFYKPQDIIL